MSIFLDDCMMGSVGSIVFEFEYSWESCLYTIYVSGLFLPSELPLSPVSDFSHVKSEEHKFSDFK